MTDTDLYLFRRMLLDPSSPYEPSANDMKRVGAVIDCVRSLDLPPGVEWVILSEMYPLAILESQYSTARHGDLMLVIVDKRVFTFSGTKNFFDFSGRTVGPLRNPSMSMAFRINAAVEDQ